MGCNCGYGPQRGAKRVPVARHRPTFDLPTLSSVKAAGSTEFEIGVVPFACSNPFKIPVMKFVVQLLDNAIELAASSCRIIGDFVCSSSG